MLNKIKPAEGSKKSAKRLGRGIGSGLGKTSGKGHKGQKARSGGYHKVGFEGGQMPLQRRLPKRGFRSQSKRFVAELRTSQLESSNFEGAVDINVLKEKKLIPLEAKKVKLFLSGELTKAVHLKGIAVSAGAIACIEKAGGSVE